eukprot:gene12107-biopygen12866
MESRPVRRIPLRSVLGRHNSALDWNDSVLERSPRAESVILRPPVQSRRRTAGGLGGLPACLADFADLPDWPGGLGGLGGLGLADLAHSNGGSSGLGGLDGWAWRMRRTAIGTSGGLWWTDRWAHWIQQTHAGQKARGGHNSQSVQPVFLPFPARGTTIGFSSVSCNSPRGEDHNSQFQEVSCQSHEGKYRSVNGRTFSRFRLWPTLANSAVQAGGLGGLGKAGLANLADAYWSTWRTWRTPAGGLGGLWRTRWDLAALADFADSAGGLGGLWR